MRWIVTDKTTEQAIQMMVQRLVDRFDPDQIILFGSQARGTAKPGSDVDLLVIMPVTGSKREKRVEMRVALHDITVPQGHLAGHARGGSAGQGSGGHHHPPSAVVGGGCSMLDIDPHAERVLHWWSNG